MSWGTHLVTRYSLGNGVLTWSRGTHLVTRCSLGHGVLTWSRAAFCSTPPRASPGKILLLQHWGYIWMASWLCYMRLCHGYIMVVLWEVMSWLCYGYTVVVLWEFMSCYVTVIPWLCCVRLCHGYVTVMPWLCCGRCHACCISRERGCVMAAEPTRRVNASATLTAPPVSLYPSAQPCLPWIQWTVCPA